MNLSRYRRERKAEALERQAARDERTPQQQLQVLDKKLGAGLGAKKERDRLQALIDRPTKKKETSESQKTADEKPKLKAKDRRKMQHRKRGSQD